MRRFYSAIAATLLIGMPLAAVSAADVAQPLAPSASNLKAPNFEAYEHAVLRTLDKVTARTSTLEVPVNDILSVGTLSVTVRTCQKTPPTERPEAAAFIEIIDTPPEREPRPMFSGWMFASSPGLSALEHPIYDVWVVDCKMAPKASSAEGE